MTEKVTRILDQWVATLASVIETMTDTHAEVAWQPASGPPDLDEEALCWEQPFRFPSEAKVWVVAPRAAWELAGTFTLKAAGLDTIELSEARNTWLEILGQSLTTMSRAISEIVGYDVATETGTEAPPQNRSGEWASVEIRLGETVLAPVLVRPSEELAANLEAPQPGSGTGMAGQELAPPNAAPQTPKHSPTMELLLDIDLPVSISFGSAHLPLREVVKLNTGSIVELDRLVGDPVEVLVNHRLIARGEVVVVEGNYGVRIQEIVSHKERLRSVQ